MSDNVPNNNPPRRGPNSLVQMAATALINAAQDTPTEEMVGLFQDSNSALQAVIFRHLLQDQKRLANMASRIPRADKIAFLTDKQEPCYEHNDEDADLAVGQWCPHGQESDANGLIDLDHQWTCVQRYFRQTWKVLHNVNEYAEHIAHYRYSPSQPATYRWDFDTIHRFAGSAKLYVEEDYSQRTERHLVLNRFHEITPQLLLSRLIALFGNDILYPESYMDPETTWSINLSLIEGGHGLLDFCNIGGMAWVEYVGQQHAAEKSLQLFEYLLSDRMAIHAGREGIAWGS